MNPVYISPPHTRAPARVCMGFPRGSHAVPGQRPLDGFPDARALAGLRREVPAGPARLLTQLVLRGLRSEHHEAAALLVLALDAHAAGHDNDTAP